MTSPDDRLSPAETGELSWRKRLRLVRSSGAVRRFETMQQSRRLEAALLHIIALAPQAPRCR